VGGRASGGKEMGTGSGTGKEIGRGIGIGTAIGRETDIARGRQRRKERGGKPKRGKGRKSGIPMAIGTGAGTMTEIVTEIEKGRGRGKVEGIETGMGGKNVIAREIAMMIGTGAGIGGTRVKCLRRDASAVLSVDRTLRRERVLYDFTST
jgi:hypothetical protein